MALLLRSYFFAIFDDSKLTLLALFDVSAAFDTVGHVILLERLNIIWLLWYHAPLAEIISQRALLLCGLWAL